LKNQQQTLTEMFWAQDKIREFTETFELNNSNIKNCICVESNMLALHKQQLGSAGSKKKFKKIVPLMRNPKGLQQFLQYFIKL
jgi:hypothetical protein